MSVLNQSGEEQVECPLCMEPLEVDDLNFFPCTCGYQICRFCWHRIRTDENGLCPACRKAYSENPADFIPLSQEQVAKLKSEKRHRDQQRKAKLSESRKHLASVRVVQRNLVFVVGLPMRLADAEVLKRHEYFGKFGKIHKVVINQSTSYAGSQGPSASAYVTYMKSDDALRAIQSVNNITIDGRLIKSSLGTTKYCSHFMKNLTCPKPDCMYLHDFGDPEASFTKEQMHAGKHQEYEKKLHESLVLRAVNNNNQLPESSKPSVPIPTINNPVGSSKSSSKENITTLSSSVSSSSSTTSNSSGTNKEGWPHLNTTDKEKKEKERGKKNKTKGNSSDSTSKNRKELCQGKIDSRVERTYKAYGTVENHASSPLRESESIPTPPSLLETHTSLTKLPPLIDDNTSFFSLNSFQKVSPSHPDEQTDNENDPSHTNILTDVLPNINTTEDWAAAFGFARHTEPIIEGKKEDLVRMETSGKGFGQLDHDPAYCKRMESYNGFYDMSPKLENNLMDILSNKIPNGFSDFKQDHSQTNSGPSHNAMKDLDQNMSKFFTDFHKNNKELGTLGGQQQQFPNGFNGVQPSYYSGVQNNADRLLLLQQKQLEEQLMNLSLKHGYASGPGSTYQNGVNPQPFMNGENRGFNEYHGHMYENSNLKQNTRTAEDDLGFDPFQETQKALAEMIASEQNHKTQSTGHSQLNGLVHNQNNSHLPPPPGFVQQNSHMNSFGSKILPFLNMSRSPQHMNISSTSSNWPSSFNPQLQQQQQQKTINNTCNDWKILDPAILSSSRHYPIANMPQIRDHYQDISQVGTQQNGAPLRPFDFTNNAFSNFTQQLQPNFNNFSHINSQQGLNWFSNDLNPQISSPPGFRNNQATKQQEC
ncbi:CCR4-NOT transcription complex subunit 4 isoform X1 [Leptinotarsa decemlineata]|uniref:CCR4-NOT transcription complex subunit 4 isoform X1 n=1 Tax=Leptinotarsa decemlineata TaxID=7539 RepID=UPI003D304C6F